MSSASNAIVLGRKPDRRGMTATPLRVGLADRLAVAVDPDVREVGHLHDREALVEVARDPPLRRRRPRCRRARRPRVGTAAEGVGGLDAELADAGLHERAELQAPRRRLLAGEHAIAEAVGLQQVAAHVEQHVGLRRVAAALDRGAGEVALAERQRQRQREDLVRRLRAREPRDVRGQRGRARQRQRPAERRGVELARRVGACAAPARSASGARRPASKPRTGARRGCGPARARRRCRRSPGFAARPRRRCSSRARCAGSRPCRACRCRGRRSRPRRRRPGRAPASSPGPRRRGCRGRPCLRRALRSSARR